MEKISIKIENDSICFSKDRNQFVSKNINNTNVVDLNTMIFSYDYIKKELDIVISFLNLVVLKNNVKKAIVEDNFIAPMILPILKKIPNIKSIEFNEDKELNYTTSFLLLENRNLESIKCFGMPNIMFYRFKNGIVETRCEIIFISDFMSINGIKTYSQLFNKQKIYIDCGLLKSQIDDLVFMFENNPNIKKIYVINYNEESIRVILKLSKNLKLKNINIIILEDDNCNKSIMEDINILYNYEKKYNAKIKIKYSKKYKKCNRFKELNYNIFKFTLLLIIFFLILTIFFIKSKDQSDTINLSNSIDNINNVVNSDNSNEISSDSNKEEALEYEKEESLYITYKNSYSKLVEENSDTVGWLTVNGTSINYPVVQSKDNNYYLEHSFYKNKNKFGWVFVDYRNNLDSFDKNIIIYSHNVRDSNTMMFSSLKNVLKKEWLENKKNHKIFFSIKGKSYYWDIFSVYTIENTSDYLETNYSNYNYLESLAKRSIYNFNVKTSLDDNILTLSTCYKDDKHRLVVHAKLVK